MARGMEKVLLAVILDARTTHKPEQNRFCGSSFFQSILGVEKGGGNPRSEYEEMACGTLKEDRNRQIWLLEWLAGSWAQKMKQTLAPCLRQAMSI